VGGRQRAPLDPLAASAGQAAPPAAAAQQAASAPTSDGLELDLDRDWQKKRAAR